MNLTNISEEIRKCKQNFKNCLEIMKLRIKFLTDVTTKYLAIKEKMERQRIFWNSHKVASVANYY